MSVHEELTYEDKVAIERGSFRARLNNAARQPDFVRQALVHVELRNNLTLGAYMSPAAEGRLLPLEEMFQEVYGPEGSSAFWRFECAVIQPITDLVDLFWLTCERREAREDGTKLAIPSAILKAAQMGEPWLIGDKTGVTTAQYGWQLPSDRLQVDIGQAAIWLLSKPPFRHLVPKTLTAFLDPSGRPTVAVPIHVQQAEASNVDITAALRLVYKTEQNPPNLAQVWPLVRSKLVASGMSATKQRVQAVADAEELRPFEGSQGSAAGRDNFRATFPSLPFGKTGKQVPKQ